MCDTHVTWAGYPPNLGIPWHPENQKKITTVCPQGPCIPSGKFTKGYGKYMEKPQRCISDLWNPGRSKFPNMLCRFHQKPPSQSQTV